MDYLFHRISAKVSWGFIYDLIVVTFPFLGTMLLGTSGHLVKPCKTDPMGHGSLLAAFVYGGLAFRLQFVYGPESLFFSIYRTPLIIESYAIFNNKRNGNTHNIGPSFSEILPIHCWLSAVHLLDTRIAWNLARLERTSSTLLLASICVAKIFFLLIFLFFKI